MTDDEMLKTRAVRQAVLIRIGQIDKTLPGPKFIGGELVHGKEPTTLLEKILNDERIILSRWLAETAFDPNGP